MRATFLFYSSLALAIDMYTRMLFMGFVKSRGVRVTRILYISLQLVRRVLDVMRAVFVCNLHAALTVHSAL